MSDEFKISVQPPAPRFRSEWLDGEMTLELLDELQEWLDREGHRPWVSCQPHHMQALIDAARRDFYR